MNDLDFINKLIEKTKKDYTLWIPEGTQEFSCVFNKASGKKLEFVYTANEEEGEESPDAFFVFFRSGEGKLYKQIFAHNYTISENPLLGPLKELFSIIMSNQQKQFEEDCNNFF